MSNQRKMISVTAGALLMAAFGSTSISAITDISPDVSQSWEKGYTLASADKAETNQESPHGSHEGMESDHEGMKSDDKKKYHDKCGKTSKIDQDKDGKISKKEFMQYQKEKFNKKDLNNDGFIDKDEMRKMMKKMHGHGHGSDKAHGEAHGDNKSHDDNY